MLPLPSRSTVSLLVVAAVLVLLLVLAPDVLLLVFGGVLLAVFLRGGGDWIASRLGDLDPRIGVAIFLLLLIAALGAAGVAAAPAASEQFDELTRRIPEAAERLRDRLEDREWGRMLLERLRPGELLGSGSGASSAVTATFGAAGNIVFVLFVGLYLAVAPGIYRRGVIALFAPSIRPRAGEIMDACTTTLRHWLIAQFVSMSVVGVLTWLGLMLLGVPLSFILGLIAGLLAFIPTVGPIIAAIPGLLLAFTEGPTTVLWVAGVYFAVQAIESYGVTPFVQQHTVDVPPAMVIFVLLLFGGLFGILGLILATPIAAAVMTLVRLLYVDDYLERDGGASRWRAED